MPNMKSPSLTLQKLWRRLKFTTDKQTDKPTNKQDKNNMPQSFYPGHNEKIGLFKEGNKTFNPQILSKEWHNIALRLSVDWSVCQSAC